ncbi:hypothetical protein KUV57_13630 [Epibacterium sp. DP7N7-1]|nr:hypothetical protein [Epibacterium sp. DP7N7-1]
MDEMSCVDMNGCISVFTEIDPEVTSIQTWNEIEGRNFEDTSYSKRGDTWQSMSPDDEAERKKSLPYDAFALKAHAAG